MTRSTHDTVGPTPKISIITVSFNSEATICATIDSVNSQTYQHIEHIFVDGASSDQTVQLIEVESLRTKKIISEPDEGIYAALNKGIALATGDIVGFLHADDFYAHKDVLDQIAKAFAKNEVSGVYGDLHYVSQSNPSMVIRRWETKPFTTERLKRGWMPPHPTLYIRKSWYDRIGGFDTRYQIAADYDSILRLFSLPDFHSQYIPNVLVKMRLGGASNRSLKNIFLKSREDLDALKRANIGGVFTLLMKNFRKLSQFQKF